MKTYFITLLFMALSPALVQARDAILQQNLSNVDGQIVVNSDDNQLYIGNSRGLIEVKVDGQLYPISTVARDAFPKAACKAFDRPLLDVSTAMNKSGELAVIFDDEGKFVGFENATDIYARIVCGKSR